MPDGGVGTSRAGRQARWEKSSHSKAVRLGGMLGCWRGAGVPGRVGVEDEQAEMKSL